MPREKREKTNSKVDHIMCRILNIQKFGGKNIIFRCLMTAIEFMLVFVISFAMLKYVNREVKLLAFHLDDLNNYTSFLEFPKLSSWIIPYDPTRMHYRPVFYFFLFIIFKLITGNVSRLLLINLFVNSVVSTGIYFLMRSLKINRILSALSIVFYSYISYSYFQIYQAIGIIEALPLLVSLIILVLSIKSENSNIKTFNIIIITNWILYIIMVFTHERYFPMMLLILIQIVLNKNVVKKAKYFAISFIEFFVFFAIRYYHLRIIVPRGTDCSDLIANFDLLRSFKFIFHQIMYLLGANLGPRYLCGMNIYEMDKRMIIFIVLSAVSIVAILVINFATKTVKKYGENNNKNHINVYILLYIFLCILQSSLTIRVELRWLYASFMALFIYLAYTLNLIINIKNANKNMLKRLTLFIFIVFYASRMWLNRYYKKYDNYIFLINEQKPINTLALESVYKYGIEKIRDMTIIMPSENFNIISDYEKIHFFDPFDGKFSDRDMIVIDSDADRINAALSNENEIVIVEDLNYQYKEIK